MQETLDGRYEINSSGYTAMRLHGGMLGRFRSLETAGRAYLALPPSERMHALVIDTRRVTGTTTCRFCVTGAAIAAAQGE